MNTQPAPLTPTLPHLNPSHEVRTSQGEVLHRGTLATCQAFLDDEESCMVNHGFSIEQVSIH